MLLFLLVSIILAVFCLCLAGMFFQLSRGNLTDVAPTWPRKPIAPGVAVGSACLVWSAYYGCLMLEGNLAKFHSIVWALVPITIALSMRHLMSSSGGTSISSETYLPFFLRWRTHSVSRYSI